MQIDVQVGQDQLILDELPDNTRHLIAVEFYDGIGHLDLGHANDPFTSGSNTQCTLVGRLARNRHHQTGHQEADAERPEDRHIEQPPPR